MAKPRNRIIYYLPSIGIGIFIILYFVAASFYPGGSDVNEHSKGFSWLHNYWCELLAASAFNGEKNPARPIAITAMFVLAISLSIFWYLATTLFKSKIKASWFILYPGIFSMAALILLFFEPHDLAINVASVAGMIAFISVEAGLYRNKMLSWFWLGILCILLCLLNNYVYYGGNSMYYLPIIQKITFVAFLSWFAFVGIKTRNILRPN